MWPSGRLGVGFECFASPLNARFTRFCSAFPVGHHRQTLPSERASSTTTACFLLKQQAPDAQHGLAPWHSQVSLYCVIGMSSSTKRHFARARRDFSHASQLTKWRGVIGACLRAGCGRALWECRQLLRAGAHAVRQLRGQPAVCASRHGCGRRAHRGAAGCCGGRQPGMA